MIERDVFSNYVCGEVRSGAVSYGALGSGMVWFSLVEKQKTGGE